MKHERYTANHYALPMCQANLLNIAWTRCQGVNSERIMRMSDKQGHIRR